MIDPAWLFTDPVPSRVKGWSAKPRGGVTLREAFMSPEHFGAGANVMDVGSSGDVTQEPDPAPVYVPPPPPPRDTVRDDWRLDRAPAPAYTPPPRPSAPEPAPSPPPPSSSAAPTGAPWRMEDVGIFRPIGAPAAPSRSVAGAPIRSTVSVSGAQDIGGDWTEGLGMIGNVAAQAGHNAEGQMVAQSIARTEGGLFKAEGDKAGGGSYGPFQFYWQGQLPNYARAKGMSLNQAAKFAEDNPEDAAAWALQGYLGDAIRKGQQLGLHGADLATYAQTHGQVSKSPERAGQWFNTLFSGANGPIAGRGTAGQDSTDQQAASVSASPRQSAYVFPVQGYQGDVSLHWGDVSGGSDLFAPRGTPVMAMRGGKVVEAGFNSIGGNSVLIQADDGNQYYYAHFDKAPAVNVGDTISTGTYLGPVGNTGDAAHTGTHLHIGIGPSIRLGADKYGGTGGDFDAVGLLRGALQGARSTGPIPARASPDRQEEQAVPMDRFPASGEPVDWFSYVDSGQEVMKITWDNGQTTYHVMGPAVSHGGKSGTVLNTGTLGAGADVIDSGDGGDDQTEWPLPNADRTGLVSTTTPAPPLPIPADREERAARSTISPAPSTDSESSSSSAGTPSSDQQTEWHLPDLGQTIQNASQAVSGTIGGAASAVSRGASDAVQGVGRAAGNLVAAPGGPTPGASQPVPSDTLTRPLDGPDNQVEWSLPDITPSLQAPPPDTPFGKVVQAGIHGQAADPTTQLLSVPEWFGKAQEASDVAATAINPARDVPVLGGIINATLNPEMGGPLGTLTAAGDLAKAAGAVKPLAGRALGEAAADVKDLWDPLTHTFQDSWERLSPDVGEQVSPMRARAPAQAAVRPAITLAGGAAGAVQKMLTTDPNSPDYWPAVLGASIGAGVVTGAAVYGGPEVYRFLRDHLAPTEALASRGAAATVGLRAGRMNGAKGGRWLWENRITEVLGRPGKGNNTLKFAQYIEENGKAPPGSSPAVQSLVDDLVKYTEDTRDEGMRLGYIKGDITTRPDTRGITPQAYMPRVLEQHLTQAKQAPGVWTGKLNPRDNYTHMRKYVSLFDGEAAGIKYADSVSDAFGHYAEHVESSRANALFLKDMKRFAPGTVIRWNRSLKNLPADWVRGDDKSIGGMRQWQNVAFSPEMAKVLRNIVERSSTDPRLDNWMRMVSYGKHAILAPSLYHLVNEERQVIGAAGAKGIPTVAKSVFYTLFPGQERKFWMEPQTMSEAKRAMDAGLVLLRRMPDAGPITAGTRATMAGFGAVTGGTKQYLDERADPTKTEQQRIEDSLKAAGVGALGGAAASTLSKRLWETSVPYMKFSTWKLLEPTMGEKEAARYVNNTFGGLNLEAIGRSPGVQRALRIGVFAPDWTESWIRQVGNAFLPSPAGKSIASGIQHSIPGVASPRNVAEASRQFWLRSAAMGAFTLEGLNLAINGHFTDKNGSGNETLLETTGLYDRFGWDRRDDQGHPQRMYEDILTVFRGLLNAPLDFGKFAGGRQGLIPSLAEGIASGKDWRGQPVAPTGASPIEQAEWRTAYALSRFAPAGPSEVMRELKQGTGKPLGVTAAQAALGVREYAQSPVVQSIKDRDDQYRQAGIDTEQEQSIRTVYAGQVLDADRKVSQAFADPGDKTHQQIANRVRDVNFPNLQETIRPFEPKDVASDPVKHADWIAKIQNIRSIGGSVDSPGQADIDWSQLPITVDQVRDSYYSPPGTSASDLSRLTPEGRDRLGAQALGQLSIQYDIDPDVLTDNLKAKERGLPEVPKLPGISSGQLNQIVQGYRAIQDDDPATQGDKRRQYLDQTAQEHNLDPGSLYQRVKLRSIPLSHLDPNEPNLTPDERSRRELQTSYERAQDLLHDTRDPTQYPKYANPDGTPYKGSSPDQWAQFDQQVLGATTREKQRDPSIKALVDAKANGDAKRARAAYQDKQAGSDFERWFGVGRNMDEAHWQQYANGTGKQFTDLNDPTENRRRTRTLELWKASTPEERKSQKVKIKVVVDGQVREEVTTLDLAKRHIERAVDTDWKTKLGLDASGTGVQQ